MHLIHEIDVIFDLFLIYFMNMKKYDGYPALPS